MNGELILAWSRTWQEIWLPLANSSQAPDDFFIELVRELAPLPQHPVSPPTPSIESFDASGELVDAAAIRERDAYEEQVNRYIEYRDRYETALNSETNARRFFRNFLSQIKNETEAVHLLEIAHSTLVTYENSNLADRFHQLTRKFIVSFNLRYEVREPFSLHATIPGLFSKLISELKNIAAEDEHLRILFSEFEEAFSDLKFNRTQARIKTCLQKQFNLLEALGRNSPDVTEATLGSMCNQLSFPHATIREIGKKLYGFGSNYPGVRHGGDANSVIRQLNMTDFVSLSLMLTSFAPYVTSGLDYDRCYTA